MYNMIYLVNKKRGRLLSLVHCTYTELYTRNRFTQNDKRVIIVYYIMRACINATVFETLARINRPQ